MSEPQAPYKVSSFRPQRRNANKHTARGLGMLEKSIQKDGWIGAQTAAADGEMIAGSARLEVAGDKFADVAPIVVDSDGSRPVIIRRTDIPSADDPRAVRLALADNRIAQIDLDWDVDVLKEIAESERAALDALFSQKEIDALDIEMELEDAFGKLPDEDRAPFQQMTFTLHDTQAEQVREALKIAKAQGDFADSENENSNGNALARICETYISDYGNG